MALTITQTDFSNNINKYLDQVSKDDEIVYVTRPNSRSVAIVSQDKLYQIKKALYAKERTLAFR